ncbi:hypothetical protein [Pseudomonas bharatica]|uniref:hypothetical protein n=1 Tax=Pseudomonas bharatica TaxID=2692112 RepID=UPI003B284FF0
MTTEREIAARSMQEDHLSEGQMESPAQHFPHTSQRMGESRSAMTLKQKPVKIRPYQHLSKLGTAVHAKELTMHKRSILSKNIHNPQQRLKANTLLNQPLPTETVLKSWRDTTESDKLATAVMPLYWMGQKEGWELRRFTLMLNEKLSDRMDAGDTKAFEHVRDQITRSIKQALGADAHFLYGIEKAPAALAADGGRWRWHIHGLIVGRTGFDETGKTPLRKALQGIKGEAHNDLAFHTPDERYGRCPRASALGWGVYTVKNGLSVQLNPALSNSYNLAPGRQTFISGVLKREAKRWHEGKLKGVTERMLREQGLAGLYELQVDM